MGIALLLRNYMIYLQPQRESELRNAAIFTWLTSPLPHFLSEALLTQKAAATQVQL